MIVGFTITDFNGNEDEAIKYIQRVCVLEDPKVAENIVAVGVGVNIFAQNVTLSDLKMQSFSATPIETQDGKFLVVSAVNFNLELLYNGSILRLVPTEYVYITPDEVSQFLQYAEQKLIKFYPDVVSDGEESKWILDEGLWNDSGVWVDSDFWRDSQ